MYSNELDFGVDCSAGLATLPQEHVGGLGFPRFICRAFKLMSVYIVDTK